MYYGILEPLNGICKVSYDWYINHNKLSDAIEWGFPQDAFPGGGGPGFSHDHEWYIELRQDVKFLKQALKEHWEWFSYEKGARENWWNSYDELTREYLLIRACDAVWLCEIVNKTFPPLSCEGAEEVVKRLCGVLLYARKRIAEEEEKETIERERIQMEKHCAYEMEKIGFVPPDALEARILTDDERGRIKDACLEELDEAGVRKTTLGVIIGFANFCEAGRRSGEGLLRLRLRAGGRDGPVHHRRQLERVSRLHRRRRDDLSDCEGWVRCYR